MIDELNNRYAEQTAIRTRLTELGLSATLAEIDRMKQFHSVDTIARMLDTAHKNSRAREFLDIVLRKVREDLSKPSHVIGNADTRALSVPLGNVQPALFTDRKFPALSAKFPLWGGHRPMLRREPDNSVPVLTAVPRTASLHIYGKQAALTIEAGQSPKDAQVVFVEAAAKSDSGYDWDSKIRLMLTFSEMLHVLAVFLNHLPRTSGKHHGLDRDKWFEIEHQARHVFMKIGQGGVVRAVPIGSEDAFRFAALLSAQIRQNVPTGAQDDIHLLLRHIVAPMATAACA